MAKETRNYKDTVFCDLYYSDKTARANLLELYNGLYGRDLKDVEAIEKVRLEDVLFRNARNDVSFTAERRRIILTEHQSFVNPNIPLRMLMYVAREYEQIVPPEARYSRKLHRLMVPDFYVFYNGQDDSPAEHELHLSDAFMELEGEEGRPPRLQLDVKVINLNLEKRHPLLEKCGTLWQYGAFVEKVRGLGNDKRKLERAVRECIKEGILEDYLRRKGAEVVGFLTAEYDYDMDIAVQRREAAEEAAEEAEKKWARAVEEASEKAERRAKIEVYYTELRLSPGEIAAKLGLSEEYVRGILSEEGLTSRPQ